MYLIIKNYKIYPEYRYLKVYVSFKSVGTHTSENYFLLAYFVTRYYLNIKYEYNLDVSKLSWNLDEPSIFCDVKFKTSYLIFQSYFQ